MPAGAFHPLFTPACFLVAVARVVGESPGTVSAPTVCRSLLPSLTLEVHRVTRLQSSHFPQAVDYSCHYRRFKRFSGSTSATEATPLSSPATINDLTSDNEVEAIPSSPAISRRREP